MITMECTEEDLSKKIGGHLNSSRGMTSQILQSYTNKIRYTETYYTSITVSVLGRTYKKYTVSSMYRTRHTT